MKLRLILMCTVVVMSLCLSACSLASRQVSLKISCDDFYKQHDISKEVEVAVGDSFIVALCSNPSTGFQWAESAEIGDKTVLEQTEHKFVSPGAEDTKPIAPGTPGQEVWTFKALKKGTSTISMVYGRPWEGGEKGEWLFDLAVNVK